MVQIENFNWNDSEPEDLWEMLRGVVRNSGYGKYGNGGPILVLDFSLENLRKLFPNSHWLDVMSGERQKGLDETGSYPKSELLRNFCDWFDYRAGFFVKILGLGNALIKLEEKGLYGEKFSFYGWGIFLDALQQLVGGKVDRPSKQSMVSGDFSLKESEIVRQWLFPTWLKGGFVSRFPCGRGPGIHYYMNHPVYGVCHCVEHWSETKGYVIPETDPARILGLLMYDLMEAKAQGYGNGRDADGNMCPYPVMKYDFYLDWHMPTDYHFRSTDDSFRWCCGGGRTEEIEFELPDISGNEFWHRLYPTKESWRKL